MRRTALVTGGSRRIGAAIVRQLVSKGWHVLVHSRRPNADLDTLIAEANSLEGSADSLFADLSTEDAVKALANSAKDKAKGRLDLLVNNASVFEDDTLETVNWDRFDKHMTVHVKAPITLAQSFAEMAPGDNRDRLIVNIIDQRVWRLNPHFTTYTLSKAALWTLTQTLAQSLAPAIRVNAIGPGPTLPNEFQNSTDFEGEAKNILLQKTVSPEDIGQAINFLWSAKSITGQMLALDGGQHLAWATPDVISGGAAGL